jgi:hypothetical protein
MAAKSISADMCDNVTYPNATSLFLNLFHHRRTRSRFNRPSYGCTFGNSFMLKESSYGVGQQAKVHGSCFEGESWATSKEL